VLKPYSIAWPRNFNLALPSLPLAAALEKDREVNFLYGSVSGKSVDEISSEIINTELGSGEVIVGGSKLIKMKWGNPSDLETRFTLRELVEDLQKQASEYRFNTHAVGTVVPVKGIFSQTDLFPTLDGVEELYFIEQSSGNYTSLIRRQLRMTLPNPYYYLRHKIADIGILPRKQFADLHIRSIVGTRSIAGIEKGEIRKGYTDLYKDLPQILTTHAGRKFWECTGQPVGIDSQASVYRVMQPEFQREGLETIAFGLHGFEAA